MVSMLQVSAASTSTTSRTTLDHGGLQNAFELLDLLC